MEEVKKYSVYVHTFPNGKKCVGANPTMTTKSRISTEAMRTALSRLSEKGIARLLSR